jgi:hypothetical protein
MAPSGSSTQRVLIAATVGVEAAITAPPMAGAPPAKSPVVPGIGGLPGEERSAERLSGRRTSRSARKRAR